MNPQYYDVARRAGHRCEYCHAPEALFNFPFEVEHIVPRSRGGRLEPANLALACRSCNTFKRDHVAASSSPIGISRLFNPRLDSWSDHFDILESGQIIGLTEVGRQPSSACG